MTQATCDLKGRDYATKANTKARDKIEVDEDFGCIDPTRTHILQEDGDGLYVYCVEGQHYIAPQLNEAGVYVGIYHA